ncbi:MAG: alpha-ketoacid dehydrogenase subunit beta [Actinomycetota bacterium]|jgi:pyruvate dehydrogenase E1 component beta subunit|nr:alpha-ketoacid dehydrogenase subunit beta [Actinomycetota bacterium]
MVGALNAALADAMESDSKVLVFGEDVGRLGGVFRVTEGLFERFGPARCFDTPLAESGIVGLAIGLALRGYRPVAELQFDGFSYPALDQVINQLAKYRLRSGGLVDLGVVVRIPSFGRIGSPEHHSESPETYYAHTAGLKVVSPSSPADAYSMLREAVECPDPVIFLEPKQRYWVKEELDLPVRTPPFDRAVVRRAGGDVTLVAYGGAVAVAMSAAEEAASQASVSVEVVDLRSLSPIDVDTVVDSVKRTGRCIIVHEAPRTLGMGAELAALVQERAFYHLEAPVLRATGFDTPYPPARLETQWLPGVDRVLDAVQAVWSY